MQILNGVRSVSCNEALMNFKRSTTRVATVLHTSVYGSSVKSDSAYLTSFGSFCFRYIDCAMVAVKL